MLPLDAIAYAVLHYGDFAVLAPQCVLTCKALFLALKTAMERRLYNHSPIRKYFTSTANLWLDKLRATDSITNPEKVTSLYLTDPVGDFGIERFPNLVKLQYHQRETIVPRFQYIDLSTASTLRVLHWNVCSEELSVILPSNLEILVAPDKLTLLQPLRGIAANWRGNFVWSSLEHLLPRCLKAIVLNDGTIQQIAYDKTRENGHMAITDPPCYSINMVFHTYPASLEHVILLYPDAQLLFAPAHTIVALFYYAWSSPDNSRLTTESMRLPTVLIEGAGYNAIMSPYSNKRCYITRAASLGLSWKKLKHKTKLAIRWLRELGYPC